jgi:hypothetical protein
MTDLELQQLRREKWRLDGKAIRTIEQARAFVEEVGFCLMYPLRPSIPVPTFIGAFVGSDSRLPTWQHAYSDPRAAEATHLMVRLLRERSAYEANLFEEDHTANNAFLVAASAFPFFYALVGERNPKQAPKAGSRSPYSALACDGFELIRKDGPISKAKLQEALGGSVSVPALDRALGELLGKLRITRVDYKDGEGSFWDVLYRWAPEAVKEGVGLSVQQALSALLSKYLDCVVAAEPAELEAFFGKFVARSRVKEAVNALLAAREFSFTHVSGRSMLQITPEKAAVVPAPRPAPEARSKTREPFKKTFPSTRPSFKKSSFQKSSFGKPSFHRPFSPRPSFGQLSSERPPSAPSQPGSPEAGKSEFGRPSSSGPPSDRPRSDKFRPDKSRSDRPKSDRPWSERTPPGRPPSARPSPGRPSSGRPQSGRPSSGRPSSGRPSSYRSPSNRAPSKRAPSNRVRSNRPPTPPSS